MDVLRDVFSTFVRGVYGCDGRYKGTAQLRVGLKTVAAYSTDCRATAAGFEQGGGSQ